MTCPDLAKDFTPGLRLVTNTKRIEKALDVGVGDLKCRNSSKRSGFEACNALLLKANMRDNRHRFCLSYIVLIVILVPLATEYGNDGREYEPVWITFGAGEPDRIHHRSDRCS